MRVAAVAFVMIVGAAIVLAFANTLNSWVLGGLLGGLAAILLCIPISLAIFAFLTRRQEARRLAALPPVEDEMEFDDEEEGVEYEDGMRLFSAEEDYYPDPRQQYPRPGRRAPVSGYLPLPPIEREESDFYHETDLETQARRDPRNYPRQPRYPARSLEAESGTALPPSPGSTRRPATRSLSQHQSAALRRARQEAQEQARRSSASEGLNRRSPGGRSSASQRPRTSHSLSPRTRASDAYQAESEYLAGHTQQSSWSEDDFAGTSSTEELQRYPRYPRRSAYPRQPRPATDPWGELDGDDEQDERPRTRRDPERFSGNMRHPLVRRAPYLYEDDPLNEEFARQLDTEHPITRRTSLSEQYRDDED